jgi:Family of unknown function (DUF6152)
MRFGIKNRRMQTFVAMMGLLAVSAPLFAHHGTASFDTKKQLTMKATITEWYWANPHCLLKFDVKDAKGSIVHWTAETSNPPDMVNRGWSIHSLKPGDQVSVTIEPVKNGAPLGRVLWVEFPDGHKLSSTLIPAKP